MPADITSLVQSQANLVGLALIEGAQLERTKTGEFTAQPGKFKSYTVDEASQMAIEIVHNLVRAARAQKPEPFKPSNTKQVNFLLDNYSKELEAISAGLVTQDDPNKKAPLLEDALRALETLSTGISQITSQEDVDASTEMPSFLLGGDPKVLHSRDAFELISVHAKAIGDAKPLFCGDDVNLRLPQWKGVDPRELSKEYRQESLGMYLNELEDFLERQQSLMRKEHIEFCQAHGLKLEENVVMASESPEVEETTPVESAPKEAHHTCVADIAAHLDEQEEREQAGTLQRPHSN